MSTSVLKTVAMVVVVGSLSAVAYAFGTRPVSLTGAGSASAPSAGASCCSSATSCQSEGASCCSGGAKQVAKSTGCCGGQRECCATGGCVEAGCCAEGCDSNCAGEACCTGGCCDQ
ncbi:MAG: hypothetical protein ACKOGA_01980 [Planctomycetaceae bacterium]